MARNRTQQEHSFRAAAAVHQLEQNEDVHRHIYWSAAKQLSDTYSARHLTLATKVRRKRPRHRHQHHRNYCSIPLVQLLWLLGCLSLAHNSMADCPSLCECKWKSGKESVLCLNANLTHIPAPLDVSTQVLDLTGNEITHIPHDTFAAVNLLNLQKVYLVRCRLRVIERYAFRKLINLVELDLSYNALTAIPVQAFECIPELREIKLNGNPIYRVPNDAFMRVPQLVRLELSDCKVAVVEVRAFAGLESTLEWLNIDGNRLSELRSGTITSLANLHGIELARNQWNCSCALRPLRAWMLHENIPYGIPPMCRHPERLAGRPWDKIDLDDFACVPQIIATDTTAHGVEGRNVTMSCYVEGVPEPSVRWMVKNRVIANLTASSDPAASPRTAAATQGRKTYVVNMLRNASNLTILTADMQDAGIYTCAAENKAGKVEASVTLAVSRRPPDAPLGVKIVLLCVLIALLFVVGSSFGAICLCSLRRKRKMRLWNSVPPSGRSESYEKIEMATRGGGVGCGAGGKLSMNSAGAGGLAHSGGGGAVTEDNGYLRSHTTPLNCGSDDGGDPGVAIVNPSGGGGGAVKRNGDYCNVPTHCDDDDNDDDDSEGNSSHSHSHHYHHQGSRPNHQHAKASSFMSSSGPRWHARSSPQESALRQMGCAANASHSQSRQNAKAAKLEDTDLHIPRLIDIGSASDAPSSSALTATASATSTSISSQVDAATRLGGRITTWTTTPIATTKISSPHSKRNAGAYYAGGGAPAADEVSTSVFCSRDNVESSDVFDSNYPDLLDIAKYAVAQAVNSSNHQYGSSAATTTSTSGLCTLPRKLKNTGKYFKNSSDSQSPLLADNSSKYGSSSLGDASFLNDLTLGRRFSAESSYSSYPSTAPTYTTGQRSNSFLNLVQSANKGGFGVGGFIGGAGSGLTTAERIAMQAQPRRNPSLPSSPVHQQHQRSFSSAATPLLDFSSLASRSAAATHMATSMPNPNLVGVGDLMGSAAAAATGPSSVAAYDFHAAQLERFLEEYRSLQDQLCKMKETCETIRKKEAPLRAGVGGMNVGHSAQLADPVMYNAAMATVASPTTNPKTTMLKNKAILPGQPPDPPPYWLHRNAMLNRLKDGSQTDIFKS